MGYRGRQIIPVRLEDEVVEAITVDLEMRNENSPNAPWTRSDWIRAAVKEYLRKRQAGRKRPGKEKPAS